MMIDLADQEFDQEAALRELRNKKVVRNQHSAHLFWWFVLVAAVNFGAGLLAGWLVWGLA